MHDRTDETRVFVSFGNRISSREFFNTETCESGVRSNESLDGPPSIPITDDISVPPELLRLFLGALLRTPIEADELNYDTNSNLCNKRGITPLGVYLVNRMIDRGMLIEVDHASFDAAVEILTLPKRANTVAFSPRTTGPTPQRRATKTLVK